MKRTLLLALGLVALGVGTARAQETPAAKMDLVIGADVKTEAAPTTVPAASTPAAASTMPTILQTSGSCSGPGCGAGCGDCCNSCCDDCCGCARGGIYAGLGFYYVRPHWEFNPSVQINVNQTIATAAQTIIRNSQHVFEFDYGFDLAPRVFVGVVGDSGLGGRLSWWKYDQSASETLVLAPSGNPIITVLTNQGGFSSLDLVGAQRDQFAISTDLVVDVWDFDATYEIMNDDCWQLTGGAGVRYVHMSQDYSGYVVRTGLAGGLVNTFVEHSSNVLDVAGPNLFLEGSRQLGNGGLALYANGRGGVLYGDGSQTQYSLARSGVNGAIVVANATTTGRRDLLPFFEGELGVQFQGQGGGSVVPFARLGLVGQSWWGAGNGQSVGADQNLGFFGLSFLAGVTY